MKWKLFLLISILGSLGSYSMVYIGLPITLNGQTLPLPIEQLQLLSLLQSLVFVVMTSALGIALHQKVRLDSPIFKAVITTNISDISFKPILQYGIIGGLLGGTILILYNYFFQHIIATDITSQNAPLPISVRIFYGGITEEILVRWGLMTLFVWSAIKLSTKDFHHISHKIYWLAIVISALLFALLHLPMLFTMMTMPSMTLILMVIIGNSMFGIIAGYLYWKQGLESAMIAHILAHLLAFAIFG